MSMVEHFEQYIFIYAALREDYMAKLKRYQDKQYERIDNADPVIYDSAARIVKF